ncbi:MAG: baseplate J/gp47 family protein [Alphaproteobacteria bacterium]|nr:baseplate J/gp47 family protein [Alphaproteobacteria bacterium]
MTTHYSKPTLKQLRNRAISDVNTNVKGGDANLRYSFLNALAITMAGVGDECMRRIDYVMDQAFIQDANEEELIKHGKTYKFPRKTASKSDGPVVMTGTNGSVLASNTEFQRADGIKYISTEEVTIGNTGTATIPVEAINAGSIGNATAGTIISLVSPIAGVNTQGEVGTLGITGGADIEDVEVYRARLLERVQNPPMGGCKSDYEIWAKSIAGVTRAYCASTESGAGTVTVRFMMDEVYSDGIPQAADVARVENYIKTKQPATAIVYVEAPIADTINFEFSSLTPLTSDVKAAIENSLQSFFKSSSVEPGGTLFISKINEAISKATGVVDHKLTSPTADITTNTGHIPVLGSITYPAE